MIPSMRAVEAIERLRGDAVVVSTMTALKEWAAASRRRELDLDLMGAMGKASSLALGVALAQPERKVLALDCDGSLLMNLGSLVTIGNLAPANLVHFLFDDGAYTTTGGQPVPGAARADYAAIARGAGYRETYSFDELSELQARLPEVMANRGPVFVTLRVSHQQPLPPMPKRRTAEAARDVQRALATERVTSVNAPASWRSPR